MQSLSDSLDSLSDMTDMDAARIGGKAISRINNAVDGVDGVSNETKDYVVERIRRDANDELESLYDRKFVEGYLGALPASHSAALSSVEAPTIPYSDLP